MTLSLHESKNAADAVRLLAEGADINEYDDVERSPLRRAIEEGRANVVDDLLRHGADRYELMYVRGTGHLKTAVERGHRDVVDVLERHDALRAATGAGVDGETALHHVTDVEYADVLLQKGDVDVDAFSWSMGSPLYAASRRDDVGVIRALVRFGASVNRRDPEHGHTPLHVTVFPEIADFLLDHGADVNTRNGISNTPLHEAIAMMCDPMSEREFDNEEESEAAVRELFVLMDRGADVNATNDLGSTPLFLVCEFANFGANLKIRLPLADRPTPIYEQMAKCGARLDLRNVKGRTALHVALNFSNTDVVRFILATKPEVANIADVHGNLPIHFVKTTEDLELLRRSGYSKLDVVNCFGATTLCSYIRRHDSDYRSSLYDLDISLIDSMIGLCPALVSMSDLLGNSSLHYAALSFSEQLWNGGAGRLATVSGCDVNVNNAFGQTPLHLCSAKEAFDAFLQLGADPEMSDNRGRIALDYKVLSNLFEAFVDDRKTIGFRELYLIYRKARVANSGSENRFEIRGLYYSRIHRCWPDSVKIDDDDKNNLTEGEASQVKLVSGALLKRWKKITSLLIHRCDTPIGYDRWTLFQRLLKAGKLSVCKENCDHRTQFRKRSRGGYTEDHSSTCLYLLRPERDVLNYVSRLWNELNYAYRSRFTPYVDEAVCHFIDRLAEAIGSIDKRFAGKTVQIGSAFEGTKLFDPDEFDFAVELTAFADLCTPLAADEAGLYRLRRKAGSDFDGAHEDFEEFFSDDGFLLTSLLNLKFEMLLKLVLHSSDFWKNESKFELVDDDIEKEFTLTPTKAWTTITLRTIDRIGPGLGEFFYPEISIDLAPCIHVKGWWPDGAGCTIRNFEKNVVDEVRDYGCYLLFRHSNNVYRTATHPDSSAQVSFAFAECRLLRAAPPVIKAAYMVGKWLIDGDHTHENVLLGTKLFDCVTFSSHAFKTALLTCIDEMPPCSIVHSSADSDFRQVDIEELMQWLRKAFARLLTYTYQDSIPLFLMPEFSYPVWKFEQCLNYSKRLFQCFGINYRRIVGAPDWTQYGDGQDNEEAIANSHLVCWSLLDEGAELPFNRTETVNEGLT